VLDDLPRGHFATILADPPWRFRTYDKREYIIKHRKSNLKGAASHHYATMELDELMALSIEELAAPDCSLFLWATWPNLIDALRVMEAWGFTYKTCAFDWMKAHVRQADLFEDEVVPTMGMGYWTRANTEPCLLATRGRPKRLNADVRQAILEPRREHSRKPDCIYDRIERLVGGPYLELFARRQRPGWTCWGDETGKFSVYDGDDDFTRSIEEAYAEIRARVAAGGKGWPE